MTISIVHAEALAWLRTEPDCSFDAFYADAPYGLSPDGRARTWDDIERLRAEGKGGRRRKGFMNKAWDAGVPGPTFFREVVRVLKPGAPLLVFGGTRTYHRLTCALEDAGAEIVDCIAWLYGQGMPKSVNLSKVVDVRWAGYGTGLRPAFEPCVLACKPFDGTIANNARRWGVGGLWIDGCRLEGIKGVPSSMPKGRSDFGIGPSGRIRTKMGPGQDPNVGRWPPNVAIDEATAAAIDEQSGERPGGISVTRNGGGGRIFNRGRGYEGRPAPDGGYGDTGGASRFFYVAKSSRWERDFGCEALPIRRPAEAVDRAEGSAGIRNARAGAGRTGDGVHNHHPCCKPIRLTERLAALLLPPTRETPRRILNAFAGSGSEAIGADRAGWDDVIAVELEGEYIPTLAARVKRWGELPRGMSIDDVQATALAADPSQLSLLDGVA